jgi:hypothetical protein
MQELELCSQPRFVAVHVGAGYHSHKHENTYLKGKRLQDVSKPAHDRPNLTDFMVTQPFDLLVKPQQQRQVACLVCNKLFRP